MKDLTINQIKEKQKKLEEDIEKLLNDFNKETSLSLYGSINYGKNGIEVVQYISVNYSNPF